MNKKMLLLTALVALAPVLPAIASADDMYSDIKVILEDKFHQFSPLFTIHQALVTLNMEKDHLQSRVIQSHLQVDQEKKIGIAFGVLGAMCGGLSAVSHFCYGFDKRDAAPFAVFSAMSFMGFLACLCKKQVDLYYNKKKIAEINAVIVKLEAMEKALLEKVQSQ
jgi:hypothetical protein